MVSWGSCSLSHWYVAHNLLVDLRLRRLQFDDWLPVDVHFAFIWVIWYLNLTFRRTFSIPYDQQ